MSDTSQHALETTHVRQQQVRDILLGKAELAKAVLKGAVKSRDPAVVRAVIGFVRGAPPDEQVNRNLSGGCMYPCHSSSSEYKKCT